eukprot:SM000219S06668  [mRNA]  locus=s219:70643:71634:+ [translate_table: standard]
MAVDHLVYAKVKEGTPSAAVDAMLANHQGLGKLPYALQFLLGPVTNPEAQYTHALYSRFSNYSGLDSYMNSPEHISFVTNLLMPIVDDVVINDWETPLNSSPVQEVGGVIHTFMAKPKEGVSHEQVQEVLNMLRKQDLKSDMPRRTSAGLNFNVARGRGYLMGFAAQFPDAKSCSTFVQEFHQQSNASEQLRAAFDQPMLVDFQV